MKRKALYLDVLHLSLRGDRYGKEYTKNRPADKMGLSHEKSRRILPCQFQFTNAAPQPRRLGIRAYSLCA